MKGTTLATEKQTSANQANAQHSTGPTTQAGLEAISRNNFRHGLAGGDSHLTFTFVDGEDPEKFKELHARLTKDHSPQGETEVILVRRMTESEWLRARALRLQAGSLEVGLEKSFALFLRYETTHERAFYKALNELQSIRKQSRIRPKLALNRKSSNKPLKLAPPKRSMCGKTLKS